MSIPRILIAEDDPTLRDLLRLVANRCSCEVDAVPNGLQALERLRDQTYDVLLLDLMMPVVNGYDVIAQLRAMPNRPAVIVVTAMAGERYQPLESDVVTAILRKPFDLEFFTSMLTELARSMAARRVSSEDATAPAPGSDVIPFPAR